MDLTRLNIPSRAQSVWLDTLMRHLKVFFKLLYLFSLPVLTSAKVCGCVGGAFALWKNKNGHSWVNLIPCPSSTTSSWLGMLKQPVLDIECSCIWSCLQRLGTRAIEHAWCDDKNRTGDRRQKNMIRHAKKPKSWHGKEWHKKPTPIIKRKEVIHRSRLTSSRRCSSW